MYRTRVFAYLVGVTRRLCDVTPRGEESVCGVVMGVVAGEGESD